MKKFALFLAPLMAITFLTNCGGTKYTVAFDTGEGGSEVPSQKVEPNKCANKPADPTHSESDDFAYTFKEWQLNGVPFEFTTPITSDITLKAEWNIINKFTVTFDSGGGAPVANQKVKENQYATKPTDPTRGPSESTTYTFSRWEKSDGTIFDFEHTPITENITLIAKWIETVREYDITFNPNGGKWSDGSTKPIVKKFKYGEKPTCEIPTKSSDDQCDYFFSKWDEPITAVTGPKTYTAIFAKFDNNATNFVVDFPNGADNKTITFNYEGTLNNVDWGDGQTSNGESSHEYKNIGKYTINIYGNLNEISLYKGTYYYSAGNRYVTNIKLKNGITSITYAAFSYCFSLVSINIPSSVTSIYDNPFMFCSSLVSIVIDSNNPNYESRDNCNAIIRKSDNTLVCGFMGTKIPSRVTGIGYMAFRGSPLTSINIPNSVTSINHWAFHECTSLKSIFIPNSVTTMGANVFNGCSELTKIRCQAPSQPAGWDAEWLNGCDGRVVWDQPK